MNLSARNLLDSRLVDQVEALLAANHVAPELLILEVTESSMVEEASHVQASLHALKEMGVVLSIDDFGTGYSSLMQLRQLPFTEVKIDQAFVADLDRSRDSRLIIQTITDLARGLHELEAKHAEHDHKLVAVFKAIRQLMAPPPEPKRGRISFGREHES